MQIASSKERENRESRQRQTESVVPDADCVSDSAKSEGTNVEGRKELCTAESAQQKQKRNQFHNSAHASAAGISVYESEIKDHAVLAWR